MSKRWHLACAFMLAALCASAAGGDFFLRDGDRIVIVGDSITVQGNYVRYIENYLRTRFPKWNVVVRNAGINGYRADLGYPVMDDDVLLWKPTVAIVNYGMNDGRRRGGDELYAKWIVPYVDKLLASRARVVLCSNTPLDLGDPPGTYTNYNRSFVKMAAFAKKVATERGLPFVDQFNYMHPIWGKNWQTEKPVPVTDHTRPQHSPDCVHARAPGQLMMAYIILRTLGAPAEVSHAAIDAKSGKAGTRRCAIRDLKSSDQGIAFVRADEASPCWIDDKGALGMKLCPFQSELNRMGLSVTGLRPGTYAVKIEGQLHGTYSADELARGINLSENRRSPVYGPGRKLADVILRKRGASWKLRRVMLFKPPNWLTIPDLPAQKRAKFEAMVKEVRKLDQMAAKAALPKPLRYEIVRQVQGGAKP